MNPSQQSRTIQIDPTVALEEKLWIIRRLEERCLQLAQELHEERADKFKLLAALAESAEQQQQAETEIAAVEEPDAEQET